MQFLKRLHTWIDTTVVAGRRLPVRWLAIVGAAAACLLLAPWGGAEKQSADGIRSAAMVIDPDPGNPISQPGPRIRYRPKADASQSARVKSDPASLGAPVRVVPVRVVPVRVVPVTMDLASPAILPPAASGSIHVT